MRALAALVHRDLVLYTSNKRSLLITLVAPILIAAFFGAVLGGAPKKPVRVPVAVVDLDQSAISKDIIAAMKADSTFELTEIPEPQAVTEVRTGKLRAAIVIPAGFGEAAPLAMFRPGAKPEITVHIDPSQAVTLALVKGLLAQHVVQAVSRAAFGGGATGTKVLADSRSQIEKNAALSDADRRDLVALFDSLGKFNARTATDKPGAAPARIGVEMPFVTREIEVTAGDRKYNAYAHSFAGMGVQFVLFLGIELGVGVLLMRRLGLWKRLRAAPVSRGLLLGSRIVSGTLIATLLMLVIYAAAIAFFEVRIDGSIAGFAGVVLAFALLTSTFGLLIAAVGRTPEATRGLAILATLMLVMLGGAWVPTFVFPEWLQSATLVVPTRWAIDGLEAMTWRGQGFGAAIAPIGTMVAFSVAFAAIALWRFDWEE